MRLVLNERRRKAALCLAPFGAMLLVLASCTTTPPEPAPEVPVAAPTPVALDAVPDFAADALDDLRVALDQQCAMTRPPGDWAELCASLPPAVVVGQALSAPQPSLGDWLRNRFTARELVDPEAPAGLITGSRLEAGSWSRLIGISAADWISKTSQDQRWAGSYMWTSVKAAFIAVVSAVSLSALLLAVNVIGRWNDIVAVYEALRAGAIGGAALTLAQLAYLPNTALWTLAWAGGDGFSLGAGSSVSPLGTSVAPVPPIPLLAALPTGQLGWGFVALLIPVCAGVLSGWWFVRAGENHFDEWLSLKIRPRWLSLPLSTIFLGAVTGAVAAVLSGALFFLSHGSAGVGRLTDLGPDSLPAALWVGAEVAVGVLIGALVAPWLNGERDGLPLMRKRSDSAE